MDHKDTQHSYFSCRVRVPVCHAFFKQKSKLKKHYEIKHDRYCPYCYVYFSKYDELDQHVLDHAVADNNKFTCEKCSMTFTTKKKYQKHYNNKHAPYCPQCNKFFTTQSGYDQHVRDKHTRSGDKEVIIEDVGHDLGVDNNPNPYTCDICHLTFVLESKLLEHKKNQHQNQFTCDKCSISFLTKTNYQKHVKDIHEFNCGECTKVFNDEQTYQKHVKTAHKKSPVHSPIKKDQCYFGKLVNRHTDCFCNTLVHKLANSPPFREYIMNLSTDCLKNKPVSRTLRNIFKEMSSNPSANLQLVRAHRLRELVDPQQFKNARQHGIMDFAFNVINAVADEEMRDKNIIANQECDRNSVEDVIRNDIGDSVVRKMFFWVIESVFQCDNEEKCGVSYSRFETV